MILELVKRAGEMDCTLEFTFDGTSYTCNIVTADGAEWYSYSSINPIDMVMVINDYLNDPEEFTRKVLASTNLIDCKEEISNMVLGG